tara:strand:- start:174 stop:482 length:309 start_codon:yes stop_codon:yes gene_type:complete
LICTEIPIIGLRDINIFLVAVPVLRRTIATLKDKPETVARGYNMLELTLLDGSKIYIPQSRVYQIAQGPDGTLVAAVDGSESETVWHNISGFTVIREGQKIS